MKKTLRNILLQGLAAGAVMVSAALCTVSPASAQSYTWQNVKIGGGGYVPAIISHPGQQGLFYARTDVGGAYRYNSATSTWTQLLSALPASQGGLNGVDAIAIDPNNTQMLYLVGGGSATQCCGMVAISSDQGANFNIVSLNFPVNGNGSGRNVGERLQVDPNSGNILFYGTANTSGNSATNGLWKSTNGGWGWSKVTSFPALSSDDTGAGVSFIALYKPSSASGQATQRIFAGVSTQAAVNSGATLYQSLNGGATWSVVPGAPAGEFPQRGQIGPDGNLYITYSVGSTSTGFGPGGLNHGQVWKYNIAGNSWTNITPPNDSQQLAGWYTDYGFSGLSVDPNRPGVVAVMSIDRYDGHGEALFRTTNGGASWVDATAKSSFDNSFAPWNGNSTSIGNWSSVALDPANPDHAFVSWGGGIRSTSNLTASASGGTVNFKLDENGVEESVPLSLISPSAFSWGSVPLLSGMGDLCGFYHANVNQAPTSTFQNPNCGSGGNTDNLDWAKSASTIVVRVGQYGGFPGGISYNGGYSWNPFTVPAGVTTGGGLVAVTADGGAIAWAPWDSNVAPFISTNNGYSWTSLSGILPPQSRLAADGYNATNLFAYDRPTGRFYTSTNKGASWVQSASVVAWADQIVAPFGRGCDIWLYGYTGAYHNTGCGWGTWTQVPGSAQIQGIGFGKAAPGQWYPAIYMTGTLNNVSGLFRSIDGGSNWVKINDNQHQYGGFGVVTGDPKVFGTVYVQAGAHGIIMGTSAN